MLGVDGVLQVPLRELEFRFVRGSGPGGQNVNKVNSKAVLRWAVARSPSLPQDVRGRFVERFQTRLNAAGELVLASDRYRDQGRNVADCLRKLEEMLAAVARPPAERRPTRPSRRAVERRLEGKRARARTKRERRPRIED
jgi:ribosome-associated protein